MSHFVVVVIGDDHEKQLAPYHEFECTGVDDQYVVEVEEDIAAYRKQYESATETMLQDADHKLHSYFDENGSWRPEFSVEEGRPPFMQRTYFTPDGYAQVEVPVSKLQSFAEWLSEYTGREIIELDTQLDRAGTHKYGYIKVSALDGNVTKIVDRTNPQKKWDWYQVGGRWTGYFKLKAGAIGSVGRPGIMTEAPKPGYADVVKLCDVDVQGMQQAAALAAQARFDAVIAHLRGKLGEELEDTLKQTTSWSTIVEASGNDYTKAREQYNKQPLVDALKDCETTKWHIGDVLATYQLTDFVSIDESRTKYIGLASDSALVPFAVVKNGKWYERGSMGWWGAVSDEKDRDTWNHEFHKLLEGLPADTQLTAIDCHV